MRVILKLKSLSDTDQKIANLKYFSAMNSWIYKKINLPKLHSSSSFKFFCFSNIIGIKDQKTTKGSFYSIIISFTDVKVAYKFVTSLELGEKINLGEYNFELASSKFDKLEVTNNCILETPTIIEITEKRKNSKKELKPYSIDYLKEPELFKKLLAKNIIRKYNSFKSLNNKDFKIIPEDYNLFKNINIEPIKLSKDNSKKNQNKGHLCILQQFKNKKFSFIGNKLKFVIHNISAEQKNIFNIVIDSGFGIHNTYGMGFIIKK
jgi:CRISPR-associated endoribonuclease Cas6